jgi:hypothetical protein
VGRDEGGWALKDAQRWAAVDTGRDPTMDTVVLESHWRWWSFEIQSILVPLLGESPSQGLVDGWDCKTEVERHALLFVLDLHVDGLLGLEKHAHQLKIIMINGEVKWGKVIMACGFIKVKLLYRQIISAYMLIVA